MTTPILAIDPGASGGFAWRDAEGSFHCCPMPVGMSEQAHQIRMIKLGNLGMACFMERVGSYVKGNSATAAVAFARHCGNLEAIVFCNSMSNTYLTPITWMKALGGFSKDKKTRKNEIKEAMSRRFPELDVTLKTADALAMLCVAMERTK